MLAAEIKACKGRAVQADNAGAAPAVGGFPVERAFWRARRAQKERPPLGGLTIVDC